MTSILRSGSHILSCDTVTMSANAEGAITGKERVESSTAKIWTAIAIYDKFAIIVAIGGIGFS